jgi:hypothetical protein
MVSPCGTVFAVFIYRIFCLTSLITVPQFCFFLLTLDYLSLLITESDELFGSRLASFFCDYQLKITLALLIVVLHLFYLFI